MSVLPDPPGEPGHYANAAIIFCGQQVGKPYQWGAAGPNSFDCSGLMYAAFKSAGYPTGPVRWTTAGIRFMGDAVPIGQQQPGDLIMPDSGHVGIYVGDGKYLDAPHTGTTVQIQVSDPAPWAIRRIVMPTTSGQAAVGTGGFSGLNSIAGDALGPWVSVIHQLSAISAFVANPKNWIRIATGGIGVVTIGIAVFSVARRMDMPSAPNLGT